jgi:hypothetical protein
VVSITRDLLSLLCERAEASDPDAENLVLDATPADDLSGDTVGLSPDDPVLTHFYMPEAGASVSAVFGMDLGRPSGTARFLSHPDGDQRLTETDDLAERVLITVPPYDPDEVRAYDRRGDRHELRILDATPPEETLE